MMAVHRFQDPVYLSNAYLIEAAPPLLIDTGGGALTAELLERVRSLPELPCAIVLTHGHPDHVGGVEELLEAWSVPVLIHPAEREAVPRAEPLGQAVYGTDWHFRVIPTPGHSPGGVCLYEPEQRVLFSGDAVFPGGRVGRWDLPHSDYRALCASLRRLNALEVEHLYPGHGDPVHERVADHLKASEGTLKRVGERFDDARYDERIEALKAQLF